nr:non-ribosomal peptide synthetase [Gulosibacter hominis]
MATARPVSTSQRRNSSIDCSIGKPIRGSSVRVLNDQLVPCAEGEVGELYLAGPMLARGYLGRPGLTAERFVADPYGQPGSRMYRTGDLCAWENGRLTHRGRSDDQVKIRGFRVEPAELTKALEAIPGVAEAASFAVHVGDTSRLVSAVSRGAPSDAELTAALARQLPDYFIPSFILRTAALPRTPVGKIDFRALRDLAVQQLVDEDASHSSGVEDSEVVSLVRNHMRKILAAPIAEDQSFFERGGHSLSALQLMTDLAERFDVVLSLRDLFAAPTPVELARLIREKPAKNNAQDLESAKAQDRHSAHQLSPAQQRILLAARVDGHAAYQIPVRWVLQTSGAGLTPQQLQAAWQETALHHEAMRTSFPNIDGRQQIHVHSDAPTLRILPGTSQSASDVIDTELAHLLETTISPEDAPPVAICAAVRDDGGYEIALVVHHALTDEHGLRILLNDFAAACEAQLTGEQQISFAALPWTTNEFAAAQHRFEAQRHDDELAWWGEQLSGHQGAGKLPTEPTGALKTVGHSLCPLNIAARERLTAVTATRSITPFMLIHAAVALVLERVRAGDDLLLASAVAGRELVGAEQMVDCATNTVVVRHSGIGDGTVREYLDTVRDSVLSALEHSTVSFSAVQAKYGDGVNLADVFVSSFDERETETTRGSVSIKAHIIPPRSPKAPLSFALVDGEAGATTVLEYDASRISDSRARGLTRAVAHIAGELLRDANLNRPLRELELVPAAEKKRLLGDWAGEEHGQPLATFGQHFLRAVERYRNQPALTAQKVGETGSMHALHTMSYGELADKALRLAVYLRRVCAVAEQDTVAAASERTFDMVIAHVATLLSGATFMAVEPDTPAERQAQMMELMPPSVVLTSGCEDEIEVPETALHLRLDSAAMRDALAEIPGHALDAFARGIRDSTDPERLESTAYVIFTSGSTGTPKAVAVPHRGITKLIVTQRNRFSAALGKRVLYFASPSFDAAFWQLCGTLCEGGELVVIPNALRLPSREFVEFIRDQRIDAVSVPPSFLAALPDKPCLPTDVELIVGAERLSRELAREFSMTHRIWNAYGPTEATVNTSTHRVEAQAGGAVPIGVPDPGTRCYVVDTQNHLVPIGVPGELLIGGEGVAHGYVGDTESTLRGFFADPFRAGERVHRSGDCVEWNANGELMFIGRLDTQIKVRGFRIEPGEIERALEGLAGVRQAAVAVRSVESGHEQLVAYVVPAAGTHLLESDLRAVCRQRMPIQLVPDRIVTVGGLPRRASGKVDLAALPEPPALNGGRNYASDLERRVADIFTEVLELTDRCGPEDDFFALGGNSLLAAQLIDKLASLSAAGTPMAFSDLLSASTPRACVAFLNSTTDQSQEDRSWRSDPLGMELFIRGNPDSLQEPVWFVPPLAGMSWGYAPLRNFIDSPHSLIGLQAHNLNGQVKAVVDFSELVSDWADLIVRRATDAPVHLVGWSFGGAVAHGIAAELQRRGREVGLLALLDAYPRAEWGSQAPTRAETFRSALGMLGVDIDLERAAVLTDEEAGRLLSEANPLLSGLTQFDPKCMVDNFHAGPKLEASAKRQTYRGNMLFFEAARSSHRLAIDWRSWLPYVDGHIRHVTVDSTHQDMLSLDTISVIGPQINAELHRLAAEQEL